MRRLRGVLVAGAFAGALAASLVASAQAATDFDGRWEGRFRYCGGKAALVVEVKDGVFRAPFELRGGKIVGSRELEFAGRIGPDGTISEGRVVGRAASVLSGRFDGEAASGGGTDRKCTGGWPLLASPGRTARGERD